MKLTLVAMFLATFMAAPEPKSPGTVVFVCEHGSAKSVVAAAHFNQIAAERGLPFRAIARGTTPEAAMAPAAVQGLLADGLKPGEPAPTKLKQSDLDTAVRVITFCDLPSDLKPATPVGRWEVPPVSADYAKSRDAILEQIEQLVRELQGSIPRR